MTVKKSDYSYYQHIIEKHKDKPKNSSTHETHYDSGLKSILHNKLKTYLSLKENINSSEYVFKLTSSKIKLDGKKLGKERLKDCLDIFYKTAGYSLSEGSYFHVDISPNSRLISLSIND